MILEVKRIFRGEFYTIGKLYVNGTYFCDTLEDTDRGLDWLQTVQEIAKRKIPTRTAIPTGEYELDLNRVSPKYSKIAFYQRVCGGCVPYLKKVKGYEGVLIHAGNSHEDTEGCILVGSNKEKGKVLSSKVAFEQLYNDFLAGAKKRGEKVMIKIS